PLAAVFYLSFAAAALWHAPRAVDPLLERFHAPLPALVLDAAAWWERDWARLPAQRRERDASRRWSLELQVAGPLEPLRDHLLAQGWEVQPQADWTATLGLLDDDLSPGQQPVLPATLGTEAEAMLLRRPGLFGTWLPAVDGAAAYLARRQALSGLDVREAPHPQGEVPVLRLRTGQGGSGQQP